MQEFDPLKNAGNWNEPKTTYGKVKGRKISAKKGKKSTIYPFNKVYESESGHIIEVDDTPGSERLHQFHRSGTFEEVHPNGDKVTKVVRDNYTSVLRDDYVHIDGNKNLTVDKSLKLLINADKNLSTEDVSTNFDIEIGEGANVNIQINSGNCNVRLRDGDVNMLLHRGDVNIRQEAGNYNHFINGDYNLEVTGHMHVVVGEDQLTEIGGSRDVRIDGFFDHTFLTSGYKEIFVNGPLRYFSQSRDEFVSTTHQTIVGGARLAQIGGIDETTVLGLKVTLAGGIFMTGLAGASMGSAAGGGMDVTEDGRISIVCPTHYSITAPKISLTAVQDMNLFSVGLLSVGGSETNIYSAASMQIGSAGPLGITSVTSVATTSPTIHLNNPLNPAIPAIPASLGLTGLDIFRIIEPKVPTETVDFEPGPVGVWRKTINGLTPMMLIRTSIPALQAELASLDELANQTITWRETTKQTQCLLGCNSMCTVVANVKDAAEGIAEGMKTVLKPIADIANGVNDVMSGVAGVIDNAVGIIEGAVNGVKDVAIGVVKDISQGIIDAISPNGLISEIKGAIDTVTGFIGDIIQTIADIACAIVDAINDVINTLIEAIASAIDEILKAIGKIIDTISRIIAAIQKVIKDIMNAISEILNSIFDEVGNFIDGIMNGIDSIFDNLLKPIDCGKSLQDKLGAIGEIENLNASLMSGEITEEEYTKQLGVLEEKLKAEQVQDKETEGI